MGKDYPFRIQDWLFSPTPPILFFVDSAPPTAGLTYRAVGMLLSDRLPLFPIPKIMKDCSHAPKIDANCVQHCDFGLFLRIGVGFWTISGPVVGQGRRKCCQSGG